MTLRDLARAFAKGEMARDDYRRSRSALVNSILSGEVAVKNIEFPPPLHPPGAEGQDTTEPRPRKRRADATFEREPDAITQVTPARAAPPAPAPAAPKPAPAGRGGLIAGIGVAVIVVGGGAFFLGSKSSREPADAPASPPAAAAPEVPPAPAEDPLADAGRALIAQFLQDRNWSSQRMAAFQSDWSALIADQQAAALKSTDAGRLASAIYQRLLAERALAGLGDPEASLAKQRELVAFAGAIGISDPRLTVPEPAAADAAPAPATAPN
jgi:hypothetical protein